ncbi:MAG: hypothetical protein AAF721_39465, partial [Myxococcota bacterium]
MRRRLGHVMPLQPNGRLTAFALAASLIPAGGCSLLGITINGQPIGGGEVAAKPYYEGPECEAVELDSEREAENRDFRHPMDVQAAIKQSREETEYREVTYANQPKATDRFAQQAAHVVCAERVSGYSRAKVGITGQLHDAFDDFEFDHPAAAMIL